MASNELKRLKDSPILPEKRLKPSDTAPIPLPQDASEEQPAEQSTAGGEAAEGRSEPKNIPGEIDFDFEKWFLNPVQAKPWYYFEDGKLTFLEWLGSSNNH